MRLPRLIQNSLLLVTMVFVAQKACAQFAPAADFFNSGAQFYISNNIPAALERVESGLKLHPDDEKLKKLQELLKQKQQQQSQEDQQPKDQQQQQNQQDQKKQSQPQKDQKSQQKKPEDQKPQPKDQQSSKDKSSEQQKKDEQKKSEEEKRQEQQKKAEAGKKDGGKPEDQKGEGQPSAPGQMSPEEAKQMLDSQKGNEQFLKLQPNGKPEDSKKPVKDW